MLYHCGHFVYLCGAKKQTRIVSILIFLIVSYVLLSISLYMLFPKAGKEGWIGLVPGLNFVHWCDIIGRKRPYALWLLFPIVNIFIFVGMAVDMVRSFGKYKFKHSAIAVIYAPAIFFYLATKKEEKYIGPTLIAEQEYKQKLDAAQAEGRTREYKKLVANNPYRKSSAREWTEAIVFAVFAAAFIRMFLIEAYKIPTPSMESSLLVGDYLFVSKAHYGIRMPMTPIMVPLLHNRIPILNTESYLEKPDLSYRRLPALESIDHNEPIVFNWPAGDSVYLSPVRSYSAAQVRRNPGIRNELGNAKLITRPLDKKDHYIKRCIGLPGDSLEIRNKQVFINGVAAENPQYLQYFYDVYSPTQINPQKLQDLSIDSYGTNQFGGTLMLLTEKQKEELKSLVKDIQIEPSPRGDDPRMDLFPHDDKNFPGWTNDNYGPVYIPKKGETVAISPETISLYSRVINVYEHNDLRLEGNTVYINDEPATEYTFKQDYYWAMGDNRHNSEDSRAWGFVPLDHIVGKPLFIWFSSGDGKIRWNRIFSSANKM